VRLFTTRTLVQFPAILPAMARTKQMARRSVAIGPAPPRGLIGNLNAGPACSIVVNAKRTSAQGKKSQASSTSPESATSHNTTAGLGSDHVSSTQDDSDVRHVAIYEHSLGHVVSAAATASGPAIAPPWFASVQRQLDRLEGNLAKVTNAANGNGLVYEFAVVPFTNGTDPTMPPNNLPRLSSAADVDALSMADANQYLVGYGVQPNHDVNAARRLVKIHIGCKVLY